MQGQQSEWARGRALGPRPGRPAQARARAVARAAARRASWGVTLCSCGRQLRSLVSLQRRRHALSRVRAAQRSEARARQGRGAPISHILYLTGYRTAFLQTPPKPRHLRQLARRSSEACETLTPPRPPRVESAIEIHINKHCLGTHRIPTTRKCLIMTIFSKVSVSPAGGLNDFVSRSCTVASARLRITLHALSPRSSFIWSILFAGLTIVPLPQSSCLLWFLVSICFPIVLCVCIG